MSIDLDEMRRKLDSKAERTRLLNEINDIAYFGPVGELIRKLETKDVADCIPPIQTLQNKAVNLQILVNLCFEKIEKLENKK